MSHVAIAIDGPAGAGKSTVAKALAKKLNYFYLDTGAMYRLITYFAIEKGCLHDRERLITLLPQMDLSFALDKGSYVLLLDGHVVDDKLRTEEVDANVSAIAAIKEVRIFLVDLQRKMAQKGNVILDGRDIGSVVLPDATIKFYLTASVDARAKRRWLDEGRAKTEATIDDIKKSVMERDYKDMNRQDSPLRQVEDALLIDSSHLTFEETVDRMYAIVKENVL